jgi:hypothetical protein
MSDAGQPAAGVDFTVPVHDEAFDSTSRLGQTIWIDPMHDDHLRS